MPTATTHSLHSTRDQVADRSSNAPPVFSFGANLEPSGFSEPTAFAADTFVGDEETKTADIGVLASSISSSDLGLAVCALTDRISRKTETSLTVEDTLTVLLGFTSLVAEGRSTAQRLLKHFGSLAAVLAASSKSLVSILGERGDVIMLLRGVHQTIILALREPISERPLLQNSTALKNYLHISLAHEEREVVRLLFLDSKNALIVDEVHSYGTVSHAPVYPREIVRRLIEINATALIIVHNHPSGDPTPSPDDINMTRLIASVLAGIGVTLQDSVVVGRRGYTSLRSRGLL